MTTKKLDRRDFLKLSGLFAGAVLMFEAQKYFSLDPEVKFLDSLIRGTRNGKILTSYDEGQTWKMLMNFGSQCHITKLVNSKNTLFADIEVSGYPFRAWSSDGIKWNTI
jgi:hypothetical protein